MPSPNIQMRQLIMDRLGAATEPMLGRALFDTINVGREKPWTYNQFIAVVQNMLHAQWIHGVKSGGKWSYSLFFQQTEG